MFYIKSLGAFIRNLYQKKYVIGQVVRRDFKNKYLGSYLGLPWAFIQPAITILVMWVAFTYGLKVDKTTEGFYFLPWLLCGMVPWFFISDTLTAATGSLVEYSYLIKNTSFTINIIPLVKMFTALIIQVFFFGVIAVFMIAYGYAPSIYWIQVIYYVFCCYVFACRTWVAIVCY
jgi:teichoic acid transport system permease protein